MREINWIDTTQTRLWGLFHEDTKSSCATEMVKCILYAFVFFPPFLWALLGFISTKCTTINSSYCLNSNSSTAYFKTSLTFTGICWDLYYLTLCTSYLTFRDGWTNRFTYKSFYHQKCTLRSVWTLAYSLNGAVSWTGLEKKLLLTSGKNKVVYDLFGGFHQKIYLECLLWNITPITRFKDSASKAFLLTWNLAISGEWEQQREVASSH